MAKHHLLGIACAIAVVAACAGKKEIMQGSGPLHEACAAGNLDRCHEQAMILEAGTRDERRDALTAFQFGCLLKHAPSCTGLARMYGDQGGANPGVVEALQKSCDAGEAEACVRLGDRAPRVQAVTYYERACEAENGNGCHKLADELRRGWVIEDNIVRALELDEKACELGATSGCLSAGQAHLFGSGVEKNESRADELFAKTCNEATRAGCRTLGMMYDEGIGVAPNPEKAAAYFDMAGPETEVVADSPASAYIVFVDACNRGNYLGCFDAAWFLDEGVEVERNITTSREMFEKACEGGVSPACARIAAPGTTPREGG